MAKTAGKTAGKTAKKTRGNGQAPGKQAPGKQAPIIINRIPVEMDGTPVNRGRSDGKTIPETVLCPINLFCTKIQGNLLIYYMMQTTGYAPSSKEIEEVTGIPRTHMNVARVELARLNFIDYQVDVERTEADGRKKTVSEIEINWPLLIRLGRLGRQLASANCPNWKKTLYDGYSDYIAYTEALLRGEEPKNKAFFSEDYDVVYENADGVRETVAIRGGVRLPVTDSASGRPRKTVTMGELVGRLERSKSANANLIEEKADDASIFATAQARQDYFKRIDREVFLGTEYPDIFPEYCMGKTLEDMTEAEFCEWVGVGVGRGSVEENSHTGSNIVPFRIPARIARQLAERTERAVKEYWGDGEELIGDYEEGEDEEFDNIPGNIRVPAGEDYWKYRREHLPEEELNPWERMDTDTDTDTDTSDEE